MSNDTKAIAAAAAMYDEMMAVEPAQDAKVMRLPESVRDEAAGFVRLQAAKLLAESAAESMKGAANTQKMSAYNWGAQFLGEIASVIDRIELWEDYDPATREPVSEPAPAPDPHRTHPEPEYEPNSRYVIDNVAQTQEELPNPYLAQLNEALEASSIAEAARLKAETELAALQAAAATLPEEPPVPTEEDDVDPEPIDLDPATTPKRRGRPPKNA